MIDVDEQEWRRPPLEVGRLMADGLRLAWSTLPSLWPLWLAYMAMNAAAAFWTRANLGPDLMLSTEQVLAYGVVISVPSGLILGFSMRVMLDVGEGRWRVDRGMVGYVTIGMGLLLAEFWPASVLSHAVEGKVPDPYWQIWATYLPSPLMWLVMLWPTSRLLVWPIRHLLGDTSATPGESWRIMRGAARPYVVAILWVAAPLYIADMLAWEQFFYAQSYVGMGVACVVDAAWAAAACGLAAAAFRTRVLDSERLAKVFS
ncbi:hypothetical protein [Phenylobacterium sp.]|uniref:hypothetical protein n=1 Tax=Phenylobacterium sp. TaxID=1871053 RepID=UPI002ED9DAF0